MPNPWKPGDRVEVIDTYGSEMWDRVKRTGTVARAEQMSHSTMNGGGYDVHVVFDSPKVQRRTAAANRKVWTELGIGAAYIRKHANETTVRSNNLRSAR
jgi:hypothetical protein